MTSATILEAEPVTRRRLRTSGTKIQVVAEDRAYEAHQLCLRGLGWTEIARHTGYLDGKIAAMAVNAFLQKTALAQEPGRRRQVLDLELARLDELQAAFYPAAMGGDVQAGALVLKVIARRCSIMGFDKADDLSSSPRTIVISGTPEEYVAGLKAVVEGVSNGNRR